jgi:hypothetical protein
MASAAPFHHSYCAQVVAMASGWQMLHAALQQFVQGEHNLVAGAVAVVVGAVAVAGCAVVLAAAVAAAAAAAVPLMPYII